MRRVVELLKWLLLPEPLPRDPVQERKERFSFLRWLLSPESLRDAGNDPGRGR